MITITITGGDAWQRDALASEIVTNLESCDLEVRTESLVLANDEEDHQDLLRSIATTTSVRILRQA